jgi:hypothetical protein
MPEKVEEGVWLDVVTPATDEVRASRRRRFARHSGNIPLLQSMPYDWRAG